MKLENQVCSLEQGKKFKDLGITAEPLYYHNTFFNTSSTTPNALFHDINDHHDTSIDDLGDEKSYIKNHSWYPAFTAAELGVMLPPFFPSFIHDGHKHSHCRNERVDTFPLMDGTSDFETTPAHILNKEIIPIQSGETEARSRAAMLIYLIENGLVTASECNQRLLAA